MKNKSRLATIGLVLGIGGFVSCGVSSVPGLLLSSIALYRDRDNKTAAWGVILSAIPCLFWTYWWVFFKLTF